MLFLTRKENILSIFVIKKKNNRKKNKYESITYDSLKDVKKGLKEFEFIIKFKSVVDNF